MRELSLNVLDVAQNSISAEASLIEIDVLESRKDASLIISIKDNGKGMTEEQIKKIEDPFYTTRTTRKVGLGVPFFKMAAEMTGGSFNIDSQLGAGTLVTASFSVSHVDFTPIGDMEETIILLIRMNPNLDFVYKRAVDDNEFVLDTREIREILGEDVPLDSNDVIEWISGYLSENIEKLSV